MEKEPEISMSATEVVTPELSEFCKNNPLSKVLKEEGRVVLKEPWGDDTLVLRLPESPEEMIEILNDLILPPIFSALYHRKARRLEFIYSPRKAKEHGRQFDFYLNGKTISCEFGNMSLELQKIAAITRLVLPPSHTDHRNLATFYTIRKLSPDEGVTGTSFWIRDVDWDADAILALARNLNFYMWYFDRKTARIRIHEQRSISDADRMPQFLSETFPNKILGRPVDPFLLQLWDGFTTSSNLMSRILYGYQIMEYVAFYYL